MQDIKIDEEFITLGQILKLRMPLVQVEWPSGFYKNMLYM